MASRRPTSRRPTPAAPVHVDGVTYQHEMIACGKDQCRRCAGGQKGHGPYWYAYWREGERTRKRYVGKQLDLSAPAKAPKKKPAPKSAPKKKSAPTKKPAPAPAKPTPATQATIEDFAAAVRRAAARAAQTPGATFGWRKVFIAPVWDAIRNEPAAAGLDLAAFKRRLLEAHRAGVVVLSRADLTGAMDHDILARSEIRTEFSSYNFIERDDVKDPWEQ